jgi:hypothetical protein
MAGVELLSRFALLMLVMSTIIDDSCGQTGNPQYQADMLGNDITIPCTGQSGNTLFWIITSQDTNVQSYIYRSDQGLQPPYQSDFIVHNNPGPNWDLEILKLSQAYSTTYQCSISGNLNLGGQTFMIGVDVVQCPTNNQITAIEDEPSDISCSVSFYQYNNTNDNRRVPFLTLTDDNGQVYTGPSTVISRNSIQATWNLTFTANNDNMTYYCGVGFDHTVSNEYNYTCPTVVLVYHAVTTLNITYDVAGSTQYVNNRIYCEGNGRPAPSISWVDGQGNILSSSYVLTITSAFLSQPQPVSVSCIAVNTVNGQEYTVSENLTFTVAQAPTPVGTAGLEPWVIPVAVCVPLAVIIIAAIAGFLIHRNRKNKKQEVKKPAATNGNAPNSSARTYSPVSTTDPQPPPAGNAYAVRSSPQVLQAQGAPGQQSPGGFGALGVQFYTGSNQALNTSINSNTPSTRPSYPYNPRNGTTNGPSVNMNPNPGPRAAPGPPAGNPGYPYGGGPARQPSVASSSSRSSYQGGHSPVPPGAGAAGVMGAAPVAHMRSVNGSLAGSEV